MLFRSGDGVAALAPLGRPAVEVAIEQASFGEIRAVLAYAEGFAVVAAEGITRVVSPVTLKRLAGAMFVLLGAWTLATATRG